MIQKIAKNSIILQKIKVFIAKFGSVQTQHVFLSKNEGNYEVKF